MLAVTGYSVVLSVHVMAIVLAFGVTFAYPIMGPFVAKNHPGSLRALHEIQERIGKFLITPMATVALGTGLYMASDHDLFDQTWVQVPLGILVFLLGLGGAFFAPQERRAAELAPAEGQPPTPEYLAVVGRVARVGGFSSLLILVAIFFMVAKPGA
jgi:hypothetical protein